MADRLGRTEAVPAHDGCHVRKASRGGSLSATVGTDSREANESQVFAPTNFDTKRAKTMSQRAANEVWERCMKPLKTLVDVAFVMVFAKAQFTVV